MRPNSSTLTGPIRLRRARASIFGIFAVNGFLLAAWVVHIPAISDRTGISHATLGWLLLLLAGGALIGMQVTGPLADRYGSRLMVIVAGALISFGVIGPGLATDAVWLGVALTAFGFGNGALDVSMNSQAVHAERLYRRPIMSAFHAFFSIGGVVGSLLGAAALAAGWSPLTSLTVASAIGFLAVAACGPFLLPHIAHDHTPDHAFREHATHPNAAVGTSRKVLALGALAFALFLSEA
ncbi:MFS transporter, partial [Rhodococcus sp. NPDC058514]|uniref:MFS transporter n=1 Tax=Rhodococcus sp. NPDC058514 TaxID=3346532 RepID=UPI003647B679